MEFVLNFLLMGPWRRYALLAVVQIFSQENYLSPQYILLWPRIKSDEEKFGLQVILVIIIIIVIAHYRRASWVVGTLYTLSLILTSPGKCVLLVLVIRWQNVWLRPQVTDSLTSRLPCLTPGLLAPQARYIWTKTSRGKLFITIEKSVALRLPPWGEKLYQVWIIRTNFVVLDGWRPSMRDHPGSSWELSCPWTEPRKDTPKRKIMKGNRVIS